MFKVGMTEANHHGNLLFAPLSFCSDISFRFIRYQECMNFLQWIFVNQSVIISLIDVKDPPSLPFLTQLTPSPNRARYYPPVNKTKQKNYNPTKMSTPSPRTIVIGTSSPQTSHKLDTHQHHHPALDTTPTPTLTYALTHILRPFDHVILLSVGVVQREWSDIVDPTLGQFTSCFVISRW